MHPHHPVSRRSSHGFRPMAVAAIGLVLITGAASARAASTSPASGIRPSIYRCVVNGQTVYQQSACSEGRPLTLEAAPSAADRQAQDQNTAQLARAAAMLEGDRLRRDGRIKTTPAADKAKGRAGTQTALGTTPAPAAPAKPKRLANAP
ncbi:MAG: hypothetical protein RJA98_3493 [Pseudomonadota bacterium]|jgi:hypothetical protein